MKIEKLNVNPFEIPLKNFQKRFGALIDIEIQGSHGIGEISPLPNFSQETLEEALKQLSEKTAEILSIDWTTGNCLNKIANLKLLPSVAFGLESALLSILSPLSPHSISTSALLMGTVDEILKQAEDLTRIGFVSAKLKVSNLKVDEAEYVIRKLKDNFKLRIDVNRAWDSAESLKFFEKFSLNTFDYVEEPFKNPHELRHFPHPLAVDESFPNDLSIEELELLPSLKALIYKPTIQGGMSGGVNLYNWAVKRNILFVLSSSFESDLGLAYISSMAHRLSLASPIGIGTFHYLSDTICVDPIKFISSVVYVPGKLSLKRDFIMKN